MDITCVCPDLRRLSSEILNEIVLSCDSEIVVFPEYLLDYVDIPEIETDKLIIWGTKKYENQNTAFIQQLNKLRTKAKINLTPWENNLHASRELEIFEFKGIKIALMISYDIEFPALSVKLKKESVDLLIVPTATESALGFERVARCASARSVELGCAVVTCHLVGPSQVEGIDFHVGNHNLYLPAQSTFSSFKRMTKNEALNTGEVIQKFRIPIKQIREHRTIFEETNPCID